MSFSKFSNIHIEGISACVPKEIIDNIDYPFLYTDKEKRKLIKTTGIAQRRITNSNTCSSDLGFAAANELIADLNIDRTQITSLLFVSQTPDYKIPFTSNILQDRLKLSNSCFCIDINAGCGGFPLGLQMAYSLAETQDNACVLFIIAETLSKVLSTKDKSTSLLFGDGASALLIRKGKQKSISYFANYTDGKHHDVIKIPDGGFRSPTSDDSLAYTKYEDGSERNELELSMDGGAVFDFTLREVPPAVENMNKYSEFSIEDTDYFVFHQANKFILKQFQTRLSIPGDKMIINIERFGNTSGVSIPLAIVTELFDKSKRDVIHCCGFGAGLAWGNVILNLSQTKILPLIEL